MITVEEVIALDKWICRATTEEGRQERLERVRRQLFPDHLSLEEIEIREKIVAQAGEQQAHVVDGEDPMPTPISMSLTAPIAIPTKPFTWDGLISPTSPAYRRAGRHDGTTEEIDRMRKASRGSPFDADPFEVEERQKKEAERERQRRERARERKPY
jgi:hypothetical protein